MIFMRKILKAALEFPQTRYFLAAPTRMQAKDIFWNRLKEDTAMLRFRSPMETELFVILGNGSEIRVAGLDKPERLEGQTPSWSGCLITEFGNTKPGIWEEHIRPMLADQKGFAYIDGVPEAMNHYYDLAKKAAGGILPESYPIIGAYAENPDDHEWCWYNWFSSDALPKEEIDSMISGMDERTAQQELEGKFLSYEGLAYYAFSVDNLKQIEYNTTRTMKYLDENTKETVHIGMDFNVDPMTATFCHIRSDDIFQFGEAYLNHSNTFDMRDHLIERFPIEDVLIYPDSTGRAEESNATKSDIAILEKAGFRVKAHLANPRVKDRIASMNSKIRAGDGKCHYFVDPKKCPKTINDLSRVNLTADGRTDKTQEKTGLTHITSALGYMMAYLFPVRSRFVKTVMV